MAAVAVSVRVVISFFRFHEVCCVSTLFILRYLKIDYGILRLNFKRNSKLNDEVLMFEDGVKIVNLILARVC